MVTGETPIVLTETRALLGEGPLWDERRERLYWVDIERGELHRCRVDGGDLRSLKIGQRIGCIAPRLAAPGFIAGLERSIALIEEDPLKVTPLSPVVPDLPRHRCNDGKCDPDGRFWVGTYNEAGDAASGWFFRYDRRTGLTRAAGPVICANGPAFAPDGRTIYCVDTYGRTVHGYDVSPSGELSGGRVLVRFAEKSWGYPDGLTCDAEGCLWLAHWGGSRVSRFSPEGELIGAIRLPAAQVTCCTFGGRDYRTLFITTASTGLDSTSNANGLAGALFAAEVDVPGLPAARFDG